MRETPGAQGEVQERQATDEAARQRLLRAWAMPERFGFFKEPNNTHIGRLYIMTGFLFFLGAGVLALVMRAQLAVPNNDLLDPQTYNQFFTMHGTVMMFLFAVPIVEAFAVYLLPNMMGARDMPYPRLSSFGYWCYAIGGALVFSSLFFGVAPHGGWFMYPPLTGSTFTPGLSADVWILGLGFVEIAAVVAAVELTVGVLKTRAPGMTLGNIPIFAWYMLVTAAMIMIGMPCVITADLLLELERGLNMPFFDPTRGGQPLLWQHLFWLFGHPEVYIIFLPAAGMVSMMLPALVQGRLVGYAWIVMAAIAIGILSFGLWVHHMYTTGLPRLSLAYFGAASAAISVPMGIQVFAWIATLWEGRPQLRVPMLYVLGFLFTFTIGGLTGVMVATVPFDWQAHDSYFVVAHFHYVLIGGAVFPLLAAIYYWFPVITGRRLSSRWGHVSFWLIFLGFNLSFFPMHYTGLRGMPRRVYTYEAGLGWDGLNMMSTVFAFVLALGVFIILVDVLRVLARPTERDENIWNAPSLEWLSFRTPFGFRSIPMVDSRYPLWDHPGIGQQLERGEGFLPDAPTEKRETLITAPLTATPQQKLSLPGPEWLPFTTALLVSLLFVGLTLQARAFSIAAGLGAAAGLVIWLWRLDKTPLMRVDAGRGITLPSYLNTSSSHGWWALSIFLIVDAAFISALTYSYFFLWSQNNTAWPPEGTLLPNRGVAIGLGLGVLGAWGFFELAPRFVNHRRFFPAGLSLILSAVFGVVVLAGGFAFAGLMQLAPTKHTFGAITATLLGYAGVHILLGVLMAFWCIARMAANYLYPGHTMTLQLCRAWWRFTAAISILYLLLIAGYPYAA